MYLDVAPIEHRSQQFGFPFPVFSFYVDLWESNQFYSDVLFVWQGALLDVILYAFVSASAFFIWSTIARTAKRLNV